MADTAKLKALQNLSASLPVANSKVAAGQNAARQMQIQAAVQKAPATANIPEAAQMTGQTAAEQTGTQAVRQATQNVQQQGQVAQTGLGEQQTANRQLGASLQQGAQEQQMDNVQKLGQLDAKLKQDIYDRNIQFQKDETGRAVLNETQLADYARLNTATDEQYKNAAQAAQQANARNIEMLETAHKKIIEDLDFRYQQAKQSGDNQTMQDIANMKTETDARMAREKARAANSAAAWRTGGTVVGSVVGGVVGSIFPGVGTAAGVVAGGAIGGAVGSFAGSQLG